MYFLVRGLGCKDYGVYVQLLILFEVLSELGQCGLPQGVTRYIAIYRQDKQWDNIWATALNSFGITFLISCLLGLVLYRMADLVSVHWFKTPEMEMIIRQLWWLIPLNALFLLTTNFFTGLSHMKYRTYLGNFYQSVVWFFIVVMVYFWHPRLACYFWGRALLFAFGLLLAFLLFQRLVPFYRQPLSETKDIAIKLISFSTPLLFISIIRRLLIKVDILMLAYFLEPTQVAIYHIASRLSNIPNLFLDPVNTAFSPRSAKLASNNNFSQLSEEYQVISRWLLILALPISLVLLLFPGELLALFDPNFSAGKWVLITIILANLFNISTGSSGIILSMAGYPKLNLLNASIVGTGNILLNILLIPRIGIMGAALATGASIISLNVLKLIEIHYLWRLFPYAKSSIKIVAISTFTFISCHLIFKYIKWSFFLEITVASIALLFFFLCGLLLFCLSAREKEIFARAKHSFGAWIRKKEFTP